MKKYFYLAAVSAMMLTACSSDKDVLEPTPTPSTPTVVAQQQAVAFDTYLAGTTASTRAGEPEGVMTTDKLKTTGKGFGVFAMYQGDNDYATATYSPNFMYNEHISWASGWTYSPLKYWPNETTKDSQDPAASTGAPSLDRISFFAYAPYVELTTDGNMTTARPSTTTPAYVEATPSTGILAITKQDRVDDPLVEWKVSSDPDANVDLLWGVAPVGFNYTAVNGNNVETTFGKPIVNMVKPDKDQKIKFLFQHALSRIGLSVVSAIDQIAAGDDGAKFNKEQTRVLIDEVKIWGNFGIQGVLNLNNPTANVANWIEASVNRTASTEGSPLFTINATNGYLSPDLRYDATQIGTITGTLGDASDGNAAAFAGLNTGVLPSEQVLMLGGPDPSRKVAEATPAYSYGTVLYKKATAPSNDYVIATVASVATGSATNNVGGFTKDGSGKYTQVCATGATVALDGTTEYWDLSVDETNLVNLASAGTGLTGGNKYYVKAGSAPNLTYTLITANGSTDPAGDYIPFADVTATALAASGNYASDTYWRGLLPRYFMVIPSDLTPTPTTINVKITYHVVTKDTKLTDYISNVENIITKETSLQLESGKSYNLKLILGLTSVKLDATVADWLVADDAEVWLPKNVD